MSLREENTHRAETSRPPAPRRSAASAVPTPAATNGHGTAKRDRGQERLRTRYGPWAVVTGASSGIGREMALRLAEANLNLVLVARTRNALEVMASDLESRHGIEVRVVAITWPWRPGLEQWRWLPATWMSAFW